MAMVFTRAGFRATVSLVVLLPPAVSTPFTVTLTVEKALPATARTEVEITSSTVIFAAKEPSACSVKLSSEMPGILLNSTLARSILS